MYRVYQNQQLKDILSISAGNMVANWVNINFILGNNEMTHVTINLEKA